MMSDGGNSTSDLASPESSESLRHLEKQHVERTGRVESFGQLGLVGEVAFERFVQTAKTQKPEGFGLGPPWFRGETKAYSSLVPKIDRQCGRKNEKALLHQFRMRALSRRAACPNSGELSHWLCLAQHHGLPTRLLDWTESLFMAAYFAVGHEPCESDAVVWALSPELLNWHFVKEMSIGLLDGQDGMALAQGAFLGQPHTRPRSGAMKKMSNENANLGDVVLAIKAPEVDVRMMVQHAAFTIHASITPLETIGLRAGFLQRFIIPQRYRAMLTEELRLAGLHRAAAFPDLGNLALFLTDGYTPQPPTVLKP